jgi:hypothetical protein
MLSTENAVIEILPGSANDSTAAEVCFPSEEGNESASQWRLGMVILL